MTSSRKFWRVSFFVFLLAALCGSFAFPATYVPVNAAPQMQANTADLSLTMTVNNATPNRDDPVIFTITVSNAGPDVATNVIVQDLLPAGLNYVSDSGGGTYDNVTGEWLVGSVGVGVANSVTLNITSNATTTGTKTNTAQLLSSDQADPNGVTPVSVNVNPTSSDIRLTMTADNLTPSIGDIVTFTITVTNAGSINNATGVRVTDILPAGLSFISYTSSSGTYTPSTGNWTAGNLPTGGATSTKTLTLVTQVTTTGQKVNTASVTQSDQLDPDTSSNSVTITLNAPEADLSLTMSATTLSPNRTEDVVLSVTVANNGPSNATGVTVRIPLPAGLVLQGPAPAGYNAANGNWAVGSLPAGGGSTRTLTLTTRATTTGQKNVIAEVWTSNQADPNSTPGNSVVSEDDYENISIDPEQADLSLSKTVSGPVATPGDTVHFDFIVQNSGPSTATNVTVLDLLPAGYQYQSHTNGANYDPGTGIWTIGIIASNATATLRITVTVQNNPNKTNRAEIITSDQLDGDSTPGNNSNNEDDDDLAPKMDLSLTKSRNKGVISRGEVVTFTLVLTNEGAADATGVTVRDILPAGLTYVSDNGQGAYNSVTGIWTLGVLTRNSNRTLQIRARGTSIGTFSNTAEVWTADQTDVDSIPQNNSTNEDDDARVNVNVAYPKLSILINEVAWYGTGSSTTDEWIELHNPGTTPIDLTGWLLQGADGSPSIPLSGIIDGGGYFLLERTDDNTVIDAPADQIFTGDIENTAESLQLRDPSNGIIDTANANGGNWPAGTYSYNSMERSGVVPDSDTAWISNVRTGSWTRHDGRGTGSTSYLIRGTPGYANWAFSVTATPGPAATLTRTRTPTRTPSPAPPPPLVAINEFVPRPGHDWNNDGAVNVQDEYVEILNHGTIDVNLSGYSLDDEANEGSEPYRLPSITLEPGDRVVFYGSETGLLLSDGGDGVRLLKPNGQLMDAFNYTVARYADQSYCRLPDNGGLDDWNDNCFPTPGLQNSLSGDFVDPVAGIDTELLCPIADTLPDDFVFAECSPYGLNIWRRAFWDEKGWYGEKVIPVPERRWDVYAD